MSSEEQKSIDELLKLAASLSPPAVEQFYQALFAAAFCVPTREGSLIETTNPQTGETEGKIIPARNPLKEGVAIVGERGTEAHDFATVTFDGRQYVPFFSSEANLHSWLGPDAAFRRVPIEKIVWFVKGETWLYLDPNQEFGKEFSPWEIEQLRRGAEAIEDLVADQLEETQSTVSFSQDTTLYPDFRARLRTMLDIYPEIEEAFLISVDEEDCNSQNKSARQNILLGIKQFGLAAEKQAYLRDEIDFARAATLPDGISAAVLFDLKDPKSANSRLFSGAVPFYIAQKEIASSGAIGGLFNKLFSRQNKKEP